jgi:hypothetical protein
MLPPILRLFFPSDVPLAEEEELKSNLVFLKVLLLLFSGTLLRFTRLLLLLLVLVLSPLALFSACRRCWRIFQLLPIVVGSGRDMSSCATLLSEVESRNEVRDSTKFPYERKESVAGESS